MMIDDDDDMITMMIDKNDDGATSYNLCCVPDVSSRKRK